MFPRSWRTILVMGSDCTPWTFLLPFFRWLTNHLTIEICLANIFDSFVHSLPTYHQLKLYCFTGVELVEEFVIGSFIPVSGTLTLFWSFRAGVVKDEYGSVSGSVDISTESSGSARDACLSEVRLWNFLTCITFRLYFTPSSDSTSTLYPVLFNTLYNAWSGFGICYACLVSWEPHLPILFRSRAHFYDYRYIPCHFLTARHLDLAFPGHILYNWTNRVTLYKCFLNKAPRQG